MFVALLVRLSAGKETRIPGYFPLSVQTRRLRAAATSFPLAAPHLVWAARRLRRA